jgi:hypothetical protein
MALLGKRTVTGAGVLTTLALVLTFGNQAFTEWVVHHTDHNTAWGWFLRVLSWPSWAFGPSDSSPSSMRDLLARDLRALLLLVFVAAVLAIVAKSVTGGAGVSVLGWAALVFGSALAAFATAFLTSNATLLGALGAASAGSAYGLFAGWLVAIAVAGAKGGAG